MTVTPLDPFPDTEVAVLALLAGVASTVTTTPASLTPPLVQVQRLGGEDDGITDYPVVSVTCYGGSRATAWEMAEECRQLILASPCEEPGGILIDSARTITPAQQLPDPNTALRVVTATYRLGLRRSRTS
jgi:hypothetical protein